MSVGRTSRPSRAPRPPARPVTRRRARRGEGERLREEILDAATGLLNERGSAAKVSTRAVAQRVGCSSPALYLHFPDKATLIFAVCERQFTKLGELVDKALAGIDDPIERLRAAAYEYCRFALDHPEQYRIMMMDETYAAVELTAEELATMTGMTSVVRAIRDGMDRGIFHEGDPVTMAAGMWATIHGIVSLRLAKPGLVLPPLETMIEQVSRVMADGLRVRPDERASPTPDARPPAS